MADHSPRAAGERGAELAGALRRPGVADQVHAAIQRVEPRRLETAVDCAFGQADFEELGAGDDSSLPGGELGDHGFESAGHAAPLLRSRAPQSPL
jgi:hypothetical protein